MCDPRVRAAAGREGSATGAVQRKRGEGTCTKKRIELPQQLGCGLAIDLVHPRAFCSPLALMPLARC